MLSAVLLSVKSIELTNWGWSTVKHPPQGGMCHKPPRTLSRLCGLVVKLSIEVMHTQYYVADPLVTALCLMVSLMHFSSHAFQFQNSNSILKAKVPWSFRFQTQMLFWKLKLSLLTTMRGRFLSFQNSIWVWNLKDQRMKSFQNGIQLWIWNGHWWWLVKQICTCMSLCWRESKLTVKPQAAGH